MREERKERWERRKEEGIALLTSNNKILTPLGKISGLKYFLTVRNNFEVQTTFWGNYFETNFYYIHTMAYLVSGVMLGVHLHYTLYLSMFH